MSTDTADTAPEPLWDYGDASEYLRVPERTFRRWVAEGDGPPVLRLGRRARFRPSDVLAWLDQRVAS